MEQRKIKILWIDDDLYRLKLQPYIDELEDNGFEIIKVTNPDNVDQAIEQNHDIECIILDISMPTGKNIDVNEAKKGMRTGLFVLQNLNEQPQLNTIKKIVFTIVSDEYVRKYCELHKIPYLNKQEYLTDTFVSELKSIIGHGE